MLGDRDAWFDEPCSGARALDVLSSRSTWLIVREVYYGTALFGDLARQVKVSEPVLSARLKELLAQGLLRKVPYRAPGQRTRDRYALTDKGMQLMTVFFALMEWGDRHLAPDGGPVRLRHRDCGALVHVGMQCNAGHGVDADDIDVVPGPALDTGGFASPSSGEESSREAPSS
jgi:DNA-binding HxlR family transcriptional regulator